MPYQWSIRDGAAWGSQVGTEWWSPDSLKLISGMANISSPTGGLIAGSDYHGLSSLINTIIMYCNVQIIHFHSRFCWKWSSKVIMAYRGLSHPMVTCYAPRWGKENGQEKKPGTSMRSRVRAMFESVNLICPIGFLFQDVNDMVYHECGRSGECHCEARLGNMDREMQCHIITNRKLPGYAARGHSRCLDAQSIQNHKCLGWKIDTERMHSNVIMMSFRYGTCKGFMMSVHYSQMK